MYTDYRNVYITQNSRRVICGFGCNIYYLSHTLSLSILIIYDSTGRSLKDVITGYADSDSADNGALPGRSTRTA